MQVTNIRKNCMGTITFDAKFKGMRKTQDFIVYPNPSPDKIMIQSDNRVGIITGDKVTIAQGKVFAIFPVAKKTSDTIENIEELRAAIRATASSHAGSNGIVYCDNSKASEV